jgi:hypothetical protein
MLVRNGPSQIGNASASDSTPHLRSPIAYPAIPLYSGDAGSSLSVSRPIEEETYFTGRTPMPLAYFVVRSTVPDPAQRSAFDEWYSREHLPDAAKAFGVNKAWRFWSANDPSQHEAMYEFTDKAALDRATSGDALTPLVAEFDRCWPQVKRTREVLVLAEEFAAA